MTSDIMDAIHKVYCQSWEQAMPLAKQLKRSSERQTAKAVWNWIKANIRYEIDKSGKQYIKTVSRIYYDGFGDCKSFSIIGGAILQCLGIPFCFKYVGFHKGGQYKHIYLQTKSGFIIDSCMDNFNEEPEHTHSKITMAEIHELSGIGNRPIGGELYLPVRPLGDDDWDNILTLQELEIAESIDGIGSATDALINDLELSIEDPSYVAGIGRRRRRSRRSRRRRNRSGNSRPRRAQGRPKGRPQPRPKGRFGQGIKRIITAPLRLILQIWLPKAAPSFLYLFLDRNLGSLPDTIRRKRKKMERLAKILVRVSGMKHSHFMRLLRNGIKKKTGKEPMALIQSLRQGVAGIGFVDGLLKLINKIVDFFKKRKSGKDVSEVESLNISASDAPTESDWKGFTASTATVSSGGQSQTYVEDRTAVAPKEGSNNMLLYVGGAGLLLYALTQTKKKR